MRRLLQYIGVEAEQGSGRCTIDDELRAGRLLREATKYEHIARAYVALRDPRTAEACMFVHSLRFIPLLAGCDVAR